MAISDYSTTAASNTAISGIDISGATGKVKDGDNAIRQLMADIKAGVPYLSSGAYQMVSTDPGGVGPILDFYHNSASPAASDFAFQLNGYLNSSTGVKVSGLSLQMRVDDATNGSEDVTIRFRTRSGGAFGNTLLLNANAADTATAGVIGVPNGQLSFPATQNPSTDANTLDDYEEGTFTPAFSASGATFNYAANGQVGHYIKVGRVVTFTIYLGLATSGNTLTANALSVTGMPFASANVTNLNHVFPFAWLNSTTSYTTMTAALAPNSSTMLVFGATAAATSSVATVNSNAGLHATNGSIYEITGSYLAAA